MRLISVLFLLFIVLLACDKERQTARIIEGDWNLVHMKATFQDGLSEYGTGSGTLSITKSDLESYQCKFVRQTDVEFPSLSYQDANSGYLNFKNKGKHIDSYLVDGTNSISFQEEQRILMLTKTDLQIEYLTVQGFFVTQTFKRKK